MLPPRVMTRRRLIVHGTAAGATLAFVPTAWGRLLTKKAAVGPGAFRDGVASGEPTPDAITFWSRLTTDRPVSGARLIVATDEGLNRTVATTVVPTRSAIDNSLKTRVGGLKPDTIYYYAWQSKEGTSPVGRTKTAKPADSTAPISMAFSSCQNYPVGFFNGHYEAADLDPLDLYLFLGDYQYEYSRPDGGPRQSPGGTVDLQSYRDRYRLYRADEGLRELHRLQPMVHIWDDHEVEDNYTENNPRPSDLQRAAGYRVSFEWLPRMQFPGEQFRIYNRFQHGRTADVILLDQRQYRTGDGDGEPRRFLGRTQLDYFKARLKESPSTWKLVGNQAMIAPLLAGAAGSGVELNQDQWDGYDAERDELLDFIVAEGIKNVVFLTGDIHTYMSNEVPQRPGSVYTPVASEYIGGSITSEGLPIPSEAVSAANPWIKQFNGTDHGYAQISVSEAETVVTYRVSDIAVEKAPSRTLSKWRQPVNTNTPLLEQGTRMFRSGPASPPAPTPANASNPALERRRRRYERFVKRDLERLDRQAGTGRRGR